MGMLKKKTPPLKRLVLIPKIFTYSVGLYCTTILQHMQTNDHLQYVGPFYLAQILGDILNILCLQKISTVQCSVSCTNIYAVQNKASLLSTIQ